MGKLLKPSIDFLSLDDAQKELYKMGFIDSINIVSHAVNETSACMHCFIKSLTEIASSGLIGQTKSDPLNFSFRIALAKASHEEGEDG